MKPAREFRVRTDRRTNKSDPRGKVRVQIHHVTKSRMTPGTMTRTFTLSDARVSKVSRAVKTLLEGLDDV